MGRLSFELRRRGLVRWLRRKGDGVIRRALTPFGLELQRRGAARFPEATEQEIALVKKYQPYTMTSEAARWALLRAVQYVDDRKIPGDIVECGVWRGGNLMMVKDYRGRAAAPRRIYLFDTFAGMTAPTARDVGWHGELATHIYEKRQKTHYNTWAYASLEEVAGNFEQHQLLGEDVIFRMGPVEMTLHRNDLPDQIAVLRLDTDWYESTKVELEVLYPRLTPGGVLIIDDYGAWEGARKATDEYFSDRPVLLIAVDDTCRIAVKT